MKELTVVLLAGGRNALSNDLSLPRALIPVGNRPLIWYSIQIILNNSSLSSADLIVLTSNSTGDLIDQYLTTLNLKYKLVKDGENWNKNNSNEEDQTIKTQRINVGTLDSLRCCYPFIRTKSICLMSCDLFGKIDLTGMINAYRIKNACLMVLLLANNCNSSSMNKDSSLLQPGQKSKFVQEYEFYTLDEINNRLTSIKVKSDFDEHLSIEEILLKKFNKSQIRSDLFDSHLYLIDKSLLELAIQYKDSSFRKQVLPKIVRQISLGKSLEQILPLNDRNSNKSNEMSHNNNDKDKSFDDDQDLWSLMEFYQSQTKRCHLNCHYFLAETNLIRVKHVLSYFEANKQSTSIVKFYTNEEINYRERSDFNQINNESVIDDGTLIGKKTTIKSTIIGKSCRIEDKCRITNSIIFDQVLIKEGSIIQNSIVCSRSTIGNKCEISNSIICENQNIENSKKINGETISSNKTDQDLFQIDEDSI